MDLDPSSLIASLIVSGAGFVSFVYGKKQHRLPQMIVGAALMGFPYFVPGWFWIYLIGAALLGLLWAAVRFGL